MQVWERVAGRDSAPPELRGMEQRCREMAALFHVLAEQTRGEQRERLTHLQRAEQADAMALLGMRILAGEEPGQARFFRADKVGLRRGLAQAFRSSRQAMADYRSASSAGEYAPVFAQMAREQSRHMAEILALIGQTT